MQSVIALALGAFILAAASFTSEKRRAAAVTVALVAFLLLTRLFPFAPQAFTMGDGNSIVSDRDNFEELVLHEDLIRFSAHLSYRFLAVFDSALGSTPASPIGAYRLLSWLVGALSVTGLWCLAMAERWHGRAIRYTALALMTPATLMYFGYLEVGYLALSAAAFPFVARDLVRGPEMTPGLLAGAVLFGLGAALHGIGYLAIAALFVAVLAFDLPIARRLVLGPTLSAIALATALIWLWYYLAVLGFEVVPGHASGGFITRHVWEAREAESRIVHPLLSMVAWRDLSASGLIAGLPVGLVVLATRGQWPRESRLALAFALPCLVAFALFWPPQGIAVETDMVVAMFPAVFGLLWVGAQSVRASMVCAALLALGHATFWWVVFDNRFVTPMLR